MASLPSALDSAVGEADALSLALPIETPATGTRNKLTKRRTRYLPFIKPSFAKICLAAALTMKPDTATLLRTDDDFAMSPQGSGGTFRVSVAGVVRMVGDST